MFSQSDTAKTMAEITRIDPQFNKDRFLKECEFEIIPSVLEVRYLEGGGATKSMHQADLDIIRRHTIGTTKNST